MLKASVSCSRCCRKSGRDAVPTLRVQAQREVVVDVWPFGHDGKRRAIWLKIAAIDFD